MMFVWLFEALDEACASDTDSQENFWNLAGYHITIIFIVYSPLMVYSPLVNDKISDASGGEKFWDLKWAETFKNEVFGAEGAENFWGPEIMV